MIVYKITNKVNSKIYIGITEKSIEKRFKQHINAAHRKDKDYPLYKAILKYGDENFVIEQLDTAENRAELRQKEIFYISLYRANTPGIGYNQTSGGETNGGSDNPRCRLKEQDVWDIREKYNQLSPISSVYPFYKHRISFSAFEKIWEGITWQQVHMDVYSEENKIFHKAQNKKHIGESNGNALMSSVEIFKARRFYVSHSLIQTFEVFGKNYSNLHCFRSALNYGYLDIPVYKKREQKWYYRGDEIDIANFNPVSTIPVSGK